MRPLLPTLKERKRYLVYRIHTASPLRRDIREDLYKSLARTLGTFGMADAGILSVEYNEHTQTGILRTAHTAVDRVRAALLMTDYLGKTKVCIETRGVSGMINKTRRFMEAT